MKSFAWIPVLSLVALGCGDSGTGRDAGMDSSATVDGGDMATGGGDDLAGPQCSTTDPMNDNSDCTSNGFVCPSGQICVRDSAAGSTYHCKLRCDSAGQVMPSLCPCDRTCLTLTDTDGGVVGAGCVLGNTAGERCGQPDGGAPFFGQGSCAQNTFCAGMAAGPAYCLWTCTGPPDCPAQTTCSTIMNNGMTIGLACTYNYGPPGSSGGIAGGAACTMLTDTCQSGYICDGSKCQLQCNGPGDDGVGKTCAAGLGTCTAVNDPAKSKVIGYVCK